MEIRSPLASATCSNGTKVLELGGDRRIARGHYYLVFAAWRRHFKYFTLMFRSIILSTIHEGHFKSHGWQHRKTILTRLSADALVSFTFYMTILFTVEQSTRFSGIH